MYQWVPYIPPGRVLPRVLESSCCEEFILSYEDGEFFVRRRAESGGYEETARGGYGRALRAWIDLAAGHRHVGRTAS